MISLDLKKRESLLMSFCVFRTNLENVGSGNLNSSNLGTENLDTRTFRPSEIQAPVIRQF